MKTKRKRRIISIHAPREGGDPNHHINDSAESKISIHAPREGGDSWYCIGYGWTVISIHAPREGGDALFYRDLTGHVMISIHAPREGGDSKDAQFYL